MQKLQCTYTVRQVESLLKRYLYYREPISDLHGPRNQRRLWEESAGQVWRRPTISDALLERADLFRALNRLHDIDLRYWTLLHIWYGTDWSVDKILAWYRQSFPKLARATLFRWRREALRELTQLMNQKNPVDE